MYVKGLSRRNSHLRAALHTETELLPLCPADGDDFDVAHSSYRKNGFQKRVRIVVATKRACDAIIHWVMSLHRIITSAKEVTFSSAFVCLLAELVKNYLTDFHRIRRKNGSWASENTIRFWIALR